MQCAKLCKVHIFTNWIQMDEQWKLQKQVVIIYRTRLKMAKFAILVLLLLDSASSKVLSLLYSVLLQGFWPTNARLDKTLKFAFFEAFKRYGYPFSVFQRS